ncbi:hypothetical protein GGH12_003162 [Coemansia sp. RSA 1822]|nr:hypothetical protein LPJ76_002937 [Coemansia sp. RSA 638]KAJ2542399.1 hypothetical protein GGF49_002884 [Coemansia sp. RSA 1853]KAJ2562546.1 hypothetical protein GGH12_003162 [Coemansia sp. RSA 1822]
MPVQSLFGGAISIDIPQGMVDISNFREVPDNQEVFANADTDQSVIVEILESIEQQSHEAIKFHFEQLAETNEAPNIHIIKTEDVEVDGIPLAYMLVGQQQIAKFNEREQGENSVLVVLALLRVPDHTADILVSLNAPTSVSKHSSSYKNIDMLQIDASKATDQFLEMLHTFKINDYSLFG